ncbi:MAG: beta-propeller fold lactonase family protein [Anaerolineales bacterium]|nr:beta-propeller fold lactonase family protein [Anaerolineales bacterium]
MPIKTLLRNYFGARAYPRQAAPTISGRVMLPVIMLSLAALFFGGKALAWATPQDRTQSAALHSSAIALTSDGATLVVANPDSNTVTLVDTASQSVIAEVGVGVDPRTVAIDDSLGRAYVADRGSDQVTVVDLATRAVLDHIPVGYRPYGVVVSPDGGRLYVAEQGSDRLNVIDTDSLSSLFQVSLGDRPSGLALSQDGRYLYVTHLLSGQISVLDLDPYTVYLPLLFDLPFDDGALAERPAQNEAQLQPSSASHSEYLQFEIPLWSDSNLLQSIVLHPDGQKAYIPHTRSNSANKALTFDTTVFPLVSLVDLATHEHLVGQQLDLGTLDPPGVGLPFDAALTPDGGELWVVNAASNDVSVLDLGTRQLVAHIEVGDNPRGIVISLDGVEAYVNNTLAGTVSVLDTQLYTQTGVIAVTNIPLPPVLLRGKQLFHSSDDPRISNAQWIACNTCHYEGEHDGRTWSFGFAGPRNTTSLLGMIETYPLRWSGEWDESADAEFANRKENFGSGLIAGPMNCSLSPPDCVNQPPNQGRSYDLDALASFMDSLQAPLSPSHAHGEPLNAAEQNGQALFLDAALGCLDCHPPPFYTDQLRHDVGTHTPDERIGPAYDTPSLRGLFDSAPYFHDGSAATLYETLTRSTPGDEHNLGGVLSQAQIQDLILYLLALPHP